MAPPYASFACTFRNYLCAEPGCSNFAIELSRRASCERDVHTVECLANFTTELRKRTDGRTPAAVVAEVNPHLPPTEHRAWSYRFSESGGGGGELGYCAQHSEPASRMPKVRFWEDCLIPRAAQAEKQRFLAEHPEYVEAVCRYRAGVDLKGILQMAPEIWRVPELS